MRIEIEIPDEELRAVDEFATIAQVPRDRVVHWALNAYLAVDERRAAMRDHPAQGVRRRLTA